VFDINAPEFVLLVVIAIILFGPEKLPELARKAARVLRYVRNIASNAQDQLSRELGTDIDVRDLNPKAFVQKHLMNDVEPIVADVKKELTDLRATGQEAAADLTSAINSTSVSSEDGARNTRVPDRDLTPYDSEST
jgi:sec-independent protein translocase protein TatB